MPFELGSIIAKIDADISGFQKGISQAKKDVGIFGDHIQSTANAVAKFAVVAGAAGVAAAGFLGKQALNEAAKYEQQVIALTTLLGDQAKAEEHIARIKKDALKTPFNVEGLITANQLLISAGVNADKAETDILNLGDAISANGKGAVELDRIVVNLQQIKNVGNATEMDMKQFAFNGINMYQLLADSTNLPISKLKEMDITYDMISGALAKAAGEGGKYHEANLRQSASLQGLKSNLEDTVQQMMVTIANESGMFEAAKLFTAKITEFVTVAGPMFGAILKDLGTKIKEVTDFLIAHKTEVEVVTLFLTGFFLPALIAVTIQMGVNLVTSVVNSTLSIITFGIEGWKAIAMLIVKSAQLALATAAFLLHTATTIATTVATTAMTVATWLLNAALAVLTSPVFLVVAAIVALIAIGYLLIKNWDSVRAFGEKMIDDLVSRFRGFVGTLSGIGGQILSRLISPFQDAWHRIQDIMNKIRDALDFTKRHSPSVVDIINKGVREVNRAMDGLTFSTNLTPQAAAMTVSNGGQSTMVNDINIDMNGAYIGDEFAASKMGEKIGDSIIKRLQLNVRF